MRNVHFVNPRFSWAKILILGACSKTSIILESFSPLESEYVLLSCSLLSFLKSWQSVENMASLELSGKLNFDLHSYPLVWKGLQLKAASN